MNFWIFMACIAIAILLGVILERARTIANSRVSKNKVYEYADVCFNNVDGPRSVMLELARIQEKNGVVRVYDYYLVCGLPSSSEDARYGWKSIANFAIEQHEDRFVLHVPQPRLLEK